MSPNLVLQVVPVAADSCAWRGLHFNGHLYFKDWPDQGANLGYFGFNLFSLSKSVPWNTWLQRSLELLGKVIVLRHSAQVLVVLRIIVF